MIGGGAFVARELWEQSLWEQSLLAMNDDAILQMDLVACIASKLCSHRSALQVR
ncbi:hypothetical protein CFII68_10448 [Pseudomonas sp. CFII68]|nr:hypothetical protein CFII68_10448 [Pseudomonas sp. CFII68]